MIFVKNLKALIDTVERIILNNNTYKHLEIQWIVFVKNLWLYQELISTAL